MAKGYINSTPVAKQIPFDKDNDPNCSFTSETVQAVVEELCDRIATSASPGFTWGRSGTVTPNTWMLNDSVPSNTSGRTNFLLNAEIQKVFVANEDATAGITLGIYSHEGDEVNLTLLGTVITAAARSNIFTVVYPIALNKQIAIRVLPGSATAKNIVVGVLIKGSTA